MLSNPLGIAAYLLLRNDWSWWLLSDSERAIVREANRSHNTERDDYSDPTQYGLERMEEGDNWDSMAPRTSSERGRLLARTLEKEQPRSVLEIGPGAGFLSRMLCEYPTVRHYTAVDIGQSFLDYLEIRTKTITKPEKFESQFLCGDIEVLETLERKYDLIVLMSVVHHIPDRNHLFRLLKGCLSENGCIVCYDPSHYLPRICELARKMMHSRYLSRDFYMNRRNLSTHHFCTVGEYRKVLAQAGGLRLTEFEFVCWKRLHANRFAKWLPLRLVSSEIGIVVQQGARN